MEQTAQLTVPAIQENVLLMDILTVKWVRLYTQVKLYLKIPCYLIRNFKNIVCCIKQDGEVETVTWMLMNAM